MKDRAIIMAEIIESQEEAYSSGKGSQSVEVQLAKHRERILKSIYNNGYSPVSRDEINTHNDMTDTLDEIMKIKNNSPEELERRLRGMTDSVTAYIDHIVTVRTVALTELTAIKVEIMTTARAMNGLYKQSLAMFAGKAAGMLTRYGYNTTTEATNRRYLRVHDLMMVSVRPCYSYAKFIEQINKIEAAVVDYIRSEEVK